jgi:hypothetical protein
MKVSVRGKVARVRQRHDNIFMESILSLEVTRARYILEMFLVSYSATHRFAPSKAMPAETPGVL